MKRETDEKKRGKKTESSGESERKLVNALLLPEKSSKKLSEFERYKKKLERGHRLRVILGVTLLSLLVVVGVAGFGWLSDSEFGNDFRTSLMQDSDSFPISISGRTAQKMEAMNWNIALLDDTDLYVYNDKGIELQCIEHGYASPVLKTSGDRLLVYDQGGNRFKVGSDTRELFSGESASSIHAADIASNGTFAIATSSTKSAAEVKVYNEYGNEIFTWQSTDMIISMALSPDGKRAAVCLLSAQNGVVVTSLALLDLENPQLLFKEEFKEEFGYIVLYENSELTLITNKSVKRINESGKLKSSYDFEGRQIQQFVGNDLSHLVLVLGGERYMRSSQIITIDQNCNELGSMEIESAISELHADAEGFWYLNNGTIYRYSDQCEPLTSLKSLSALHILPLGQKLYVTTHDQLQCLSVR